MSASHTKKQNTLRELAAERILVLDGAMGTMIQGLKLDEAAHLRECNHSEANVTKCQVVCGKD